MRVSGNCVPQDHSPLRTELIEEAVDDGARRLLPRSWPLAGSAIGFAPPQQVELARERNAGPAHSLVAGGFAHSEHIGIAALGQIMSEIFQPDRGTIRHIVWACLAKLVKGRPNRRLCKILEEAVDCGPLATIGQWS